MIVKDYECQQCGQTHEHFITGDIPAHVRCPKCNGKADKLLTVRHTIPVDADWIRSVCEVVDKNPDKPHCQEFLRHPTRGNYKNWMKGENLRPLEPGESATPKPDPARKDKMKHKLKRRWQERNAIAI